MRVTIHGVTNFAREAGLPNEMIDRHMDAMVAYTLAIAKRERKICQRAIRAWYFNKDKTKTPLFDVLGSAENEVI